ncbi:MAG: tetraacyldisaccharide 4'-kinase [Elusimicrobia bacterium]|nr:tetraacyldisaccharide 4'-kinase [Elusimicrobiota bacterium]
MKPLKILYPFSFLYLLFFNILQSIKKAGQKRLPCKVISVGNITVGGTGKTPTVIYLAELLKKMNKSICVVSRGYKSEIDSAYTSTEVGIVTDGKKMFLGPRIAGDEPCLIARTLKEVPVVVGKSRYKAGLLASSKFNSEILILDDGFQHLNLFREVDIVCINALNPFGNNFLLPAGHLREPIKNIKRATAFIITRCDKVPADKIQMIEETIRKYKKDALIFHGFFSKRILNRSGVNVDVSSLYGKNVIAVSGIAIPDDFENTLEEMGLKLLLHRKYPDHYFFKDKDIKRYYNDAAEFQAVIITTAKDASRLPEEFPCYILDIRLEIKEKDKIKKLMEACLDKKA